MDARSDPDLELTEAEIIFLEAHDVHCPLNAWDVIAKAVAAKRADDYARYKGVTDWTPHLTPELSLLAGVCQKVTIDHESRDRFKRLYRAAFLQGQFNKEMADPRRVNPYK